MPSSPNRAFSSSSLATSSSICMRTQNNIWSVQRFYTVFNNCSVKNYEYILSNKHMDSSLPEPQWSQGKSEEIGHMWEPESPPERSRHEPRSCPAWLFHSAGKWYGFNKKFKKKSKSRTKKKIRVHQECSIIQWCTEPAAAARWWSRWWRWWIVWRAKGHHRSGRKNRRKVVSNPVTRVEHDASSPQWGEQNTRCSKSITAAQQPPTHPANKQSFTNVIKTDLDNKCTDAPLELFKKIYDSFTYCPQPQKAG